VVKECAHFPTLKNTKKLISQKFLTGKFPDSRDGANCSLPTLSGTDMHITFLMVDVLKRLLG
jgi:hypothetical protein